MKRIFLVAIAALITVAASAQKSQGLYVELAGGVTFSQNEYLRYGSFGKTIKGGTSISVGCDFNKRWGASLEIVPYAANVACDPTNTLYSTFKSQEVYAKGAYALVSNQNGKFNIYLGVGGAGVAPQHNAFTDNNKHFVFAFKGGLNYVYNFTSALAGVVDASLNAYTDAFNGIVGGRKLDARGDLKVGLRVRF